MVPQGIQLLNETSQEHPGDKDKKIRFLVLFYDTRQIGAQMSNVHLLFLRFFIVLKDCFFNIVQEVCSELRNKAKNVKEKPLKKIVLRNRFYKSCCASFQYQQNMINKSDFCRTLNKVAKTKIVSLVC